MALIDNLVSYWKLDEASDGSGAVTRNDSKGSNHLTDNNTTASAAGIISNGANFVLADSTYLSIADASQTGLEPGSKDFSISFWIKMTSQPSASTERAIAGKAFGSAESYSWVLLYSNYNPDIKLDFQVSDDGSGLDQHLFAQTLANATWKHVVVCWDASAHSVEIYVDGSSIGTENTGTHTSIYDSSAPFRIGGTTTNYTDGVIDEFGYWSRLLTSTEVTSLYNGGAGLAYPFYAGIKSLNGLAVRSVKTVNGLAIASVKTFNGLA